MQHVYIRCFAQRGGGVERIKGGLDVVGGVEEIQDKQVFGLFAQRIGRL
jgi:hypothetical protein